MSWPSPEPGLVVRYSYLWQREAAAGQEEGRKDRPCAVILARKDEKGQTRVFLLPISHSPPQQGDVAIEIPSQTKQRLGLDGVRSWVVVSEANMFAWPGPDLRPAPGKGPESVAYGFLPPRFFNFIRDRFLALDLERKAALVARTE